MNKFLMLILIALLLNACGKDNDKVEKEYPKTVTFDYNGTSATYGVIKKDYLVDASGNALKNPITKLWLDRNLGAQRAATYMNDSLAFGDLFQWGRLADGHQNRKSLTKEELSNNIIPGHDKFIIQPLGHGDWLANPDNSLWNGTENINCSCPQGWRVPTKDELLLEINSWNALNLDAAYASPLKWVSTGNRDNHGTERYSTYWAFMWTSTALDNRRAYSLAIIATDTAEIIESQRISGYAIRCVKDY
jgi:hypothetical protein